jgi:hypothetical protein
MMEITQYVITDSAWTPISSAGQSISAWLDEQDDGAKGGVNCRIYAAKTAPLAEKFTIAKRVYKPLGNLDVLQLNPDIEDDIYYARCNTGDGCILCVSPGGVAGVKTVDAFIRDQHSNIVSPYLVRELSNTTLAAEALVDTSTCTLAAGHGFVADDALVIKGIFIARVLSVVGNNLTLNQRFNMTFPAGTAVYRTSPDMVVDGSTTPIIFRTEAVPGQKFDLYKVRLAFRGTVDMDDAKFASLTALAKGVIFRTKQSDARYNNYFSARSNSEFQLRGLISYNAKAPSGSYGMAFEYSIREDQGVSIRLDGNKDQRFEIIIQDKLDGGTLTYMQGTVFGHVVEE